MIDELLLIERAFFSDCLDGSEGLETVKEASHDAIERGFPRLHI